MSFSQVKEIESTPNEPAITLGGRALPQSKDYLDMIQDFRREMQVSSGEIMQKTLAYGDSLATGIVARVKEELAGFEKPRQQILVIEVEKIRRKLEKPASPYLPDLLLHAQLGKNTLVVGPAGCGKTILGEQVAQALGREFGHVCFTAGASESWLFGRQTPNGFVEGAFSKAYRNGGVFLGDELDAADSNMLLSINTALANGSLYNPINGETIKKHENFVFIGAANTVGLGANSTYTGRNRLDGATLDRFVCTTIKIDYSPEIERMVCPDDELRERLQNARKKLAELKATQVISTRALANSYELMKAGQTMKKILDSLTISWPEGMAEQCDLIYKRKGKVKSSNDESNESIPF